MNNSNHYKKLENMYLQANVNTHIYNTTTVKISEGYSEVGLTISEKYFHALGAIHGAVYFKLLDDASYFAASSLVKDMFILTTSFNINLIRTASSGKIKAMGKIKHRSKSLYVAEAVLFNEKGQEIAFGTGNFSKSNIALSEEIGYKLSSDQ